MLGPLKYIDVTFKSNTNNPAEAFGSFLKRYLGHLHSVNSILFEILAHSKGIGSISHLKRWAHSRALSVHHSGPNQIHQQGICSSMDDPAEVFSSVLQNDVGQFNAMLSIFSTKIVAHLK